MTAAAVFRACPRVNGCPFVTTRHLRNLDLRPKGRTIALALCASIAVHLGALAALGPRDEGVLIEGGGEAAPAALGTSFEAFAAGSHQPAPPAPQAPDRPAQTVTAQNPAPLLPDRATPAAATAAQMPQQALPLAARPVVTAPVAEDALLPHVAQRVVAPELAALPPDVVRSAPPDWVDPTPHKPAVAVDQAHIPPSPEVSPRPPARPRDRTTPARPRHGKPQRPLPPRAGTQRRTHSADHNKARRGRRHIRPQRARLQPRREMRRRPITPAK